LQAAYELLSKPLEHAEYDRTGRWPDERPQGRATVQEGREDKRRRRRSRLGST
jgi:hypothetical protein